MASPVAIAAQAGKLLREQALRPRLLAVRSQAGHLTSRRWLNLQEYQSKKLMSEHGVRVQRFFVASTAKEALEAAKRLSKLVQGMSVGRQWNWLPTRVPLLRVTLPGWQL
ncbi:succinate--CoA ligase [GDP-forming] subunit beta, mitochondrial-like [Onychomys torridus]|uniref:succinate--CoA ligase [GDP-forming] subunit beta, mitochondrial-like n=1 Tax=Onychomys torridus TaxID=38674 RepID=UPI00167FDABE|nr:succinate--CoA ligase [GDP-forming] subunit beta, mitochondrial-like [Onychomys torridus]